METAPSALAKSPYAINLEVVGEDGRAVHQRPINVEDLLHSAHHTMDVGHGVTLHLEEYDPNSLYPEESGDEETYEFGTDNVEERPLEDAADTFHGAGRHHSSTGAAPHQASPPPGTDAGSWYDVLNALRREREEVEQEAARLAELGEGADEVGASHRRSARSASTPLRRFPSPAAASRTSKSMPPPQAQSVAAGKDGEADGRSRREVWSSFATPLDNTRNYRRLQYVSIMAEQDARRFRPSSLAFHGMAAYMHAKDGCQRVLVYGGLSQLSKGVEKELYEFSLLTGGWRRLEGRQFVPAGHYGHAMVVVESADRLVVIGGVGPGGLRPPQRRQHASGEKAEDEDDEALRARKREQLLFPLTQTQSRLHGRTVDAVPPAGPASALSAPSTLNTTIGFVPFLFDMELSSQRWRAVEPATPFPLAFHTAIAFGREVFVFGGLTETFSVSHQLLAINIETYSVRLIGHPSAATAEGEDDAAPAAPAARYLHSAVRHGNYMIVFGGLDHRNAPLGDLWAFDLVNERWEMLRCRGMLNARWGHAACVVGNRLLITGGFECDLDESPRQYPAEAGGEAGPTASVMEVNLIPTNSEEYLCRERIPVKPPLPPLAFSTAAACGDDASLVVFGGLTNLPKKARAKRSRSHTAAQHRGDDSSDEDGSSPDSDNEQPSQGDRTTGNARGEKPARPATLLTRYPVFADALVATFPVKAAKKHEEDDGDTYVNELGIEVSKNELPPHFKAFVRRQDDFLKKKAAADAAAMHRTTMEEKEAMEPTLYLTEDEIERLIDKSEECCTAFTESYKMEDLPSNVPDRDERIRITEECVSLSRQVRDVMKSMKASKSGVTAVKSKDHRRRAGQKFEDYSAAKPFRRIVVAHLLGGINEQLHQMHRLNRGLHTIVWEEKQPFLDAIKVMQDSVDALHKAIATIVNTYISRRVANLMKGVDKHKEVMRLLTEVVERNRRDKIFQKDQQVDKQRERVKRAWANAEADDDKKNQPGKRLQSGLASPAVGRNRSASAHGRRPSLGAGYYKEESTAVVDVSEVEWGRLCDGAAKVERCAEALRAYCQQGMAATPNIPTQQTAPAAPQPLTMPVQGTVPPPPLAGGAAPPPQLPFPTLPGAPLQTTMSVSTAPAPGTLALAPPALPPPPSMVPALPAPHGSGTQDPASAAPTQDRPDAPGIPEGTAGGLSNKEIVIRHSNEVRDKIATTAQAVCDAARLFHQRLSNPAAVSAATAEDVGRDARKTSASSSDDSPAGRAQETGVLLAGPAPLPLPTMTTSPVTGLVMPSDIKKQRLAVPATAVAAITTSSDDLTRTTTHTTRSPPPASATTAAAAPKAPLPSASEAAAAGEHGKRELPLSTLRPLLEARERLGKASTLAPTVRMNEWDDNNLAGAPQDERVDKLCKRLQVLLTALVQHVSGSFLSTAGARKPRKRIVQLSKAQPDQLPRESGRPPREPSAPRGHSSHVARRSEKEAHGRRGRSGPSTQGRSRTTTTTTRTTTTTTSATNSSPSSSSSSSSRSSSSSSSTSGRKKDRHTTPSGRKVVAVQGLAIPGASRPARTTPSAVQKTAGVAPTSRHATPSGVAGRPSSAPRTQAALQPLYTGPKSHLVQLAFPDGAEGGAEAESQSATRQRGSGSGQRRAGGVGTELLASAAPLVPYSPDLGMPRDNEWRVSSSTGNGQGGSAAAIDASNPTPSVVELNPSCGARVVPNTPTPQVAGTAAVPVSRASVGARNVFLDAGGTRPRFANDWALAPTGGAAEKRTSLVLLPPTVTAEEALMRSPVGPSPRQSTSVEATASFTRGVGPVMHSPVDQSTQDGTTAPPSAGVSRNRRSTISMLAQLQPEPVHTNRSAATLEPATSISPGTFVVNADYYAHTHGLPIATVDTASSVGADSAPGRLPGGGVGASGQAARHWADVDDDYFYFGQTVHRGTGVTTTDPSAPGPAAFTDTTNRMAHRPTGKGKATLTVPTSPPVGTVLGSQRVNASYVPARSGSARRAATARDTAASSHASPPPREPSSAARSASATRAVIERGRQTAVAGGATMNTSNAGPFRGRLTPGERQILEARERLRRR